MRDLTIAITAASYSGNKGAAAMLQSSISQLKEIYGEQLKIRLRKHCPGAAAADRVCSISLRGALPRFFLVSADSGTAAAQPGLKCICRDRSGN